MDFYGWSLKKKIGLALFVGSAIVIGGLLFIKQRSKGCPIECWYRQQAERTQSDNRQME